MNWQAFFGGGLLYVAVDLIVFLGKQRAASIAKRRFFQIIAAMLLSTAIHLLIDAHK